MKKSILELLFITCGFAFLGSLFLFLSVIIINFFNISPELIKYYENQVIIKNWLLNSYLSWIRALIHGILFNKIGRLIFIGSICTIIASFNLINYLRPKVCLDSV